MSEERPALELGGPPSANGVRILLAIIWPGLSLLAAIMLGTVALVLGVAWMTNDPSDVARLVAEAHAFTRLAALILIVTAIVILAMLEKIPGSTAVAVLGTIAGYVFGGTASGGGPAP